LPAKADGEGLLEDGAVEGGDEFVGDRGLAVAPASAESPGISELIFGSDRDDEPVAPFYRDFVGWTISADGAVDLGIASVGEVYSQRIVGLAPLMPIGAQC